jgi:hypothetical protein
MNTTQEHASMSTTRGPRPDPVHHVLTTIGFITHTDFDPTPEETKQLSRMFLRRLALKDQLETEAERELIRRERSS